MIQVDEKFIKRYKYLIRDVIKSQGYKGDTLDDLELWCTRDLCIT